MAGKRVILAGIVFLLSGIAAAQAGDPAKYPLLSGIVKPEPEARACFSRTYSARHLARHPHQTVTAMTLRLTWHVFEEEPNSATYLFICST